MGSRKDLLLKLANKSNSGQNSSRDSEVRPLCSFSRSFAFDVKKNEVLLKLNKYIDYNDTPVIFDFNNEYKTSFEYIEQNQLSRSKIRQLLNLQFNPNSKPQVKNALLYDETRSNTNEEPCKLPLEQTATFSEDLGDSVQTNKDYIPEDLSSSGSYNKSNTRKTAVSQTFQALLPRSPPALPTGTQTNWPLLRSRFRTPQCFSKSITTALLLGPPIPDLPTNSSNIISATKTQKGGGLNKVGMPQKKRVISEPFIERKKRISVTENLELKPSCGEKCPKKCRYKFPPLQRKNINKMYRALNNESKGIFIKIMVDPKKVNTRKMSRKTKRNTNYAYHFRDRNLYKIPVCKTFFLSTLGYNAKIDCRFLNILKSYVDVQKDKRSKYIRDNKNIKDVIKNHVLKYSPAISHYRREHAPKKLYLPSDINLKEMYKHYCQTEPDNKVSIGTYRHVLKKEMNISFANSGCTECELCALFRKHNTDHIGIQDQNCATCKQYLTHKNNFITSRINYKFDTENSANQTDTKCYSVDLQKVVMLPRMEQYKSAIFCSRIHAFNESFVPISKSSTNFPIAVLWNETISGTSPKEIISAYRTFFLLNRDTKKIVLWADCSSQNKNWALFSFLINIINSNLIATNTIEIKYFELGHAFMSANQFHHQVEKKLRKPKVYDFDDYVARVKSVKSMKTIVKEMNFTDFYDYDECVSQYKIRNFSPRIYLKDITYVKAERGFFDLQFKEDQDDVIFRTFNFLQNKVINNKTFPELRLKSSPRGITKEKKKEILKKLVPLMPENRRPFWLNIPTPNASNLLLD